MCPVHLDREKTTNLSQATNKLNNRATRCAPMCPVHLDREKTTNLSQATNKLNNRTTSHCHKPLINLMMCPVINLITRATRCVQYTWTGRKPPICHKPLINLITEQQDGVSSVNLITEHIDLATPGRKPPICHKPLINLITEQEDVSSTPGPGENHQSVTSH